MQDTAHKPVEECNIKDKRITAKLWSFNTTMKISFWVQYSWQFTPKILQCPSIKQNDANHW